MLICIFWLIPPTCEISTLEAFAQLPRLRFLKSCDGCAAASLLLGLWYQPPVRAASSAVIHFPDWSIPDHLWPEHTDTDLFVLLMNAASFNAQIGFRSFSRCWLTQSGTFILHDPSTCCCVWCRVVPVQEGGWVSLTTFNADTSILILIPVPELYCFYKIHFNEKIALHFMVQISVFSHSQSLPLNLMCIASMFFLVQLELNQQNFSLIWTIKLNKWKQQYANREIK